MDIHQIAFTVLAGLMASSIIQIIYMLIKLRKQKNH